MYKYGRFHCFIKKESYLSFAGGGGGFEGVGEIKIAPQMLL